MSFQIREIPTEQWVGSEFGVFKDGETFPRYTAFTPFERVKCALYVLFHPSVW